jgi:hypothetical protein
MSEYLVLLLSPDQGAREAVQQRCHVVSALPPRLLVVEADEHAAHALRLLPGVADVISWPANTLPDVLNETERLFVHAWRQNQSTPDKPRPGDGLNWDAEGFVPPDPPNPASR